MTPFTDPIYVQQAAHQEGMGSDGGVVEERRKKNRKKFMKFTILIFLFTFFAGDKVCALSFEDQFHERLMEVGWKQSLMELDRYSLDEREDILASALVAIGPDPIPRDAVRQEIFEIAQSRLLAIPGHAKAYQDKIDKMRAEVLANSKKSFEELKEMQDEGHEVIDDTVYVSEAEKAIRTLKFMPSAETVSVLGYFLNDPVGRDGKTLLGKPYWRGDAAPALCNAELATDTIRVLGIENPPFRDNKGVITPEEIDTWKDWWNEVKSGKRTYRFMGSNVEYGPDGPASQEAIQHVERDQRRDEEREAGHRKSAIAPAPEASSPATVASQPFSIVGILAAFAMIGAAVWYFLRGRKAA